MTFRPHQALSICALTACLLPLASVYGAVTFTEDFETPVVAGYAEGTGPDTGWVGSTQGFGATRHGLYNEEAETEFSTPYGDQSYRLDFTNTGLTTEEGVIGTLNSSTAYSVSFYTAKALGAGTTSYRLELVAFDGVPNSLRNEARGARPGTVLAFAAGTVTTSDFSENVELIFNAGPAHPNAGQDVGIRFIKASGAALYDNIQFNDGGVGSYVPEPTTGMSILLGVCLLGFFRRLRYEASARKQVVSYGR